jgi:hypothetical protein
MIMGIIRIGLIDRDFEYDANGNGIIRILNQRNSQKVDPRSLKDQKNNLEANNPLKYIVEY